MLDLAGERNVPEDVVRRMARAIIHRGPDEEGFLWRPGVGLASRRLSIVGLADGQQPMSNEDRSVHVVFNGELFDHMEQRDRLRDRGHRLVTKCDTEIIPHLWEDHQEGLFEKLRGQFAIALWDERKRQLTLGRDRFGIAPLFWTRQGDWLLFGSEIKAILASGMVQARPDLKAIDQIFTFSALPGPTTCFEGIQMLRPGRYLKIRPAGGGSGSAAQIEERTYWEMTFPDRGDEVDGDAKSLVDQFEQLMLGAVKKRLRADVPVGSYLSGGVDSSMILALACKVKGKDIHTYTVRVDEPELDELDAASSVARHLGAEPPIVQEFRNEDAIASYPQLIHAAEVPVVDTSCAALLQLARKVHSCGQKVVLTGEGADEWLVGYPWYKIAKILDYLDFIPGLSEIARRGYLRLKGVPQFPRGLRAGIVKCMGGPNAWIDSFGILTLAKLRFFTESMMEVQRTNLPWLDLEMDLEKAKRWNPLNRGIWVAGRVTLGGHLLAAKGDRVAMHSSVEVRYPFLDEDVYDFTSRLHPRWKLRGFRDKHLLRLLAERYLPREIYKRSKVIFRAPLDSFHMDPEPPFVAQLLSEDSLKRTGYFIPSQVHYWRKHYTSLKAGSLPRLSIELALAAIVATQLWHHLYIDASLADLPAWESFSSPPLPVAGPVSPAQA